MLFDRIDSEKLKRDIAGLVAECIELKRALRTTWTRPMADEQRRLCRRRRQLTELHVLRALSRGRRHVTAPPRGFAGDWDAEAHNARIAARVALDYARPSDQEARLRGSGAVERT